MINNCISSDICILGTGPAGLFANIRLSESGLKVINIGKNNFGSLDTFRISDRTINPIPIFPLSEDSFYRKYNKMPLSFLEIKHINTCFDRGITITKPYKKGSFVNFILDKASSRMVLD
jgi:flavin-dependent dehydrogenase